MKLIKSLQFLVVLIVVLSVFTKRVKRSKTFSRSLSSTMMEKMAEVKASCFDNSASATKDTWLYLNTDSIKEAKSGFQVKNYYKNAVFNCKYMNKISQQDSRNRYFVTYRDFSSYYGAESKENSWVYMRKMTIYMKSSVAYVFLIDKKVFGDEINQKENEQLVKDLNTYRNSYLTNYRTYRDQMSKYKVNAEALAATKAQNIQTREQLNAAIAQKQTELATTKAALKNLEQQAEAARLAIRNYENTINQKRVSTLQPEEANLKGLVTALSAVEAQIADNDKKIKGIVPIDQDDLSQSMEKLKQKLNELKGIYLSSDPYSATLSTLIAHFDTQMNTIPSVIN